MPLLSLILSLIVAIGTLSYRAQARADHSGEEEMAQALAGLVATWSDGEREITQLEGRLAFRFAAGESPHPLLSADRFEGHWRGRIFVQRPGAYRFSVEAIGSCTLHIAGKAVVAASASDKAQGPPSLDFSPVVLTYGEHPLEATYIKTGDGQARLRILWQLDDTPAEPIPASALRHTAQDESQSLAQWQEVERGRRLVLEHRCLKCHVAGEEARALAAQTRPATDLTGIGSRIYADWIYHWLLNPHEVRPGTPMPRLFGNSPADEIDIYAVTQLLLRQGQPLARPSEKINPASAERGQHAFAVTGCIACHRFPGETTKESHPLRSLNSLGSKMTARVIAQYIADPGAHHPGALMPDFDLEQTDPKRLEDIANYLASFRNALLQVSPVPPTLEQLTKRYHTLVANEAERKRLATLGEIERWEALGARVVEARGCLNCHQLAELKGTPPVAPPFARLITAAQAGQKLSGCLAEQPAGRAPKLALNAAERRAIWRFLASGVGNAKSTSPRYESRIALDRHGCTACHRRNGEGGTLANRIEPYLPKDPNQTGPDVLPPDLSGVGEKLRPEWLHQVIVDAGRARPWLDVIMPKFRRADVEALPRQLIVADGVDPDYHPPDLKPATADQLDAARLLVGRTGLNCVSCHDILGHKSTGVRGPDLAGVFTRIREPWFRRWLSDPQRITPGTRMPSVFYGGKSAAPQFLGGDPEAQIDALWAYLSQGARLEMPLVESAVAPLAADAETNRPVPIDRPLLWRAFMPGEAGLRAIALGFPERTHFAFDSHECRLTRAWTGDFIEVGGWNGTGRGSTEENGLKILGSVCWHAPDRFPFAWTTSGGDVALRVRARYEACWATKADAGFTYRAQVEGHWVEIEERPAPVAGLGRVAFRRTLTLRDVPDGVTTWFCFHQQLSQGNGITLWDSAGRPLDITPTPRTDKAAWSGCKNPDGPWFISSRAAPPGTRWRLTGNELAGPGELWIQLPPAHGSLPQTISLVYVLSDHDDPPAIATWQSRLAELERK